MKRAQPQVAGRFMLVTGGSADGSGAEVEQRHKDNTVLFQVEETCRMEKEMECDRTLDDSRQ